jgi:exopolyphosphatase/guanosine-5'-triphosphate,3'-diphosphate pyrophosphatase
MARNSNEFIELARNQGTPIIVLSGTEEAEYGFRSVADDPTFARYQRISIVDIGGQSTELVTAERLPKGWEILCKYSLPLGTLGLRSGVLHAESPDATAYLKAIKEIDSIIQLENLPSQAGQVITLGATGTNLVSIREKMTCWDPQKVHGAYVTRTETKRLLEWMFRMTDQQRSEIIGIEPGREKTLHIGALILERFLHALQAEGCLVSVRSWRHALLEKSI